MPFLILISFKIRKIRKYQSSIFKQKLILWTDESLRLAEDKLFFVGYNLSVIILREFDCSSDGASNYVNKV